MHISQSVFIKQHSHVCAYVTKMTDAASPLRAKCRGRRWLGAREWRHSHVDTMMLHLMTSQWRWYVDLLCTGLHLMLYRVTHTTSTNLPPFFMKRHKTLLKCTTIEFQQETLHCKLKWLLLLLLVLKLSCYGTDTCACCLRVFDGWAGKCWSKYGMCS